MLTTLVFLLLNSASAQEIPSQIDEANKQVQQMQGPALECATCAAARATEEPLWKQCIQELCPDGYGRPQQKIREKFNSPWYQNEDFKPIAHLYFDASKQAFLDQKRDYQFLLDGVNRGEKLTDPNAILILNFFRSLQQAGKVLLNEDMSVDVQKTFDGLLMSGESAANATLQIEILKVIAAKNKSWKSPLIKDDFNYVASSLGPGEIKAEALRLWREYLAMSKTAKEILHFDTDTKREREAFEKKLNAGLIDRTIVDSLRAKYTGAATLTAVFANQQIKKSLPTEPVSLTNYIGEDKKSLIQKKIGELDVHAKNSNYPKDESNLTITDLELIRGMLNCYEALTIGQAVFPTKLQIADFLKREKDMRKDYAAKLTRHISAESAKELLPKIAQWKIIPPTSRDEFVSDLKAGLQRIGGDANESMMRAQSSSSKREEQIVLAVALSDTLGKLDDPESEGKVATYCKESVPNIINDEAIKGKNQIQVGPITATEEQMKSVPFHEYTHLLSWEMTGNKNISKKSRGWFDKIQECLIEDKDGNKMTANEDMSDQFEYSFSTRTQDFCVEDLWTDSSPYFTTKPTMGDVHSSFFFRMLKAFKIQTGSVPRSCKDLLKNGGEVFSARDCMKQADANAAAR